MSRLLLDTTFLVDADRSKASIDDLIAGVELGIDTFDCALPTRLGRHGVALVPEPVAGWRVDLVKGRWRQSRDPILDGCRCPACAGGFSRAYLHYLMRAGELTALRLVTMHNLWFIARLMEDLRAGVDDRRLDEVAAALRGGAPPGTFAGADRVSKTPETARTESRPGA